MKEKTVLYCAAFFSLLVQPTYQHGYSSGSTSSSSSQSYSSASASSYATSSSYSSSGSFGGKSENLINGIGIPFGSELSGTKANAQANAFASAGAQSGLANFGVGTNSGASAGASAGGSEFGSGTRTGADSKASAENKYSSNSRGPVRHDLGVGGGIGIDNIGSIEGTSKYGSLAIKSNCRSGSCLGGNSEIGFGGLSGQSRLESNAGSSGSGGIYSTGNGFDTDKLGSVSSIISGDSKTIGSYSSDFDTGTSLINGCGGSSGGCGSGSYSSGKPIGLSGTTDATSNTFNGCGGNAGGCGVDNGQYPSNIKPFTGGSGFVTGNVQVLKPTGEITSSVPCSGSDKNCKGVANSISTEALGSSGSNSGNFATGTSKNSGITGILPSESYFLSDNVQGNTGSSPCSGFGINCKDRISGVGNTPTFIPVGLSGTTVRPVVSYSEQATFKPGSSNGLGFATGSVQVTKPTTGGLLPSSGIYYSGPFPGPSLSISHSIPATFVTPKPSGVSTVAGSTVSAGAKANAGAVANTAATTGSISPFRPSANTVFEGHYTGPFPGPLGSIYQSKPASLGRPLGSPHTGGSTASSQAGTTSSSGSHYTGSLPGPVGNIHQNKPTSAALGGSAASAQAGSTTSAEAGSTASAEAGSTANAQAGSALTSGTSTGTASFSGPVGSIYQSKPISVEKPSVSSATAGSTANAQAGFTSDSGTYIKPESFPGPVGSIYQSKPIFTQKPSGSSATAGSTVSAQVETTPSSGTHYVGVFLGPSGNILQSTKIPGSVVTSTISDTGSHYTGPFPGPVGSIYKSTSVAGGTSGGSYSSNVKTGATDGYTSKITGTTPFTEKPIINIITIPKTRYDAVSGEKIGIGKESNNFAANTASTIGGITSTGCPFGSCTPVTPSGSCKGPSCQTTYFVSSTPSVQIPLDGSIKSCKGPLCTTSAPQYAPSEAGILGSSTSCEDTAGFGGKGGCGSNTRYDANVVSAANVGSNVKAESSLTSGASLNTGSVLGLNAGTEYGAESGISKSTGIGANVGVGSDRGSSTITGLTGNVGSSTAADSGAYANSGIKTGFNNVLSGTNLGGGVKTEDNTGIGAGIGNDSGFGINAGFGGNIGANANTGSTAKAGSGTLFTGCLSCKNGGASDFGSGFNSNAFSKASSNSFGGSFNNAKSGSSSYSSSNSQSASQSFAGSSSSSGSLAIPLNSFGGAQSSAYANSFASAQSSASAGHY